MKLSQSFTFLLVILFFTSTAFVTNTSTDTPSDRQALKLIKKLERTNGGWKSLTKLNDVEFQYTYEDFAKNAKDISTERYIFGSELSWAEYSQHNVNVLPGIEGKVKQCLVNGKPEITVDGNQMTDPEALGMTTFLRSANYFWFTMMYKLDDPGTINKYLGKEEVDGINYDKVSLTYENTGKENNDSYILYFNPKSHLVDFFYFSLPAWGINETILRMELQYEKINGVYVNSTRHGVYPDAEGNYSPGGVYTYSNIKFNNGFTEEDLAL